MSEHSGKEVRRSYPWHAMQERVSTWTDRLGRPVDHGIRDTVVAFNLLGLPTVASCEGHDDHGTPAPWICIHVERGQDMEHGVLLAAAMRSRIDQLLTDYYATTYMPDRLRLRTGIVWHPELDMPSSVRVSIDDPQLHDLAAAQADMRDFNEFLITQIDIE